MRSDLSRVRAPRALFVSVLALSLAAVASSSPAFGADPTAAELNEGRTRFNRGVELFKEGNFGAALAEFEAGYRAAPSYKIRYNLAQARYELQDYVGAIADFEAYLREGGDRIPAARRDEVARELDKLKQRIATLIVRTHEKSAQVLVDGAPAAKVENGSATMRISSGRRRVELIFPGRPSEIRVVDLAGATETVLEVDPPAPVVVADPTPAPTPTIVIEEPPPSRAPAYVAFGFTGLFVAGATTFAILAANRRSAYDDSVQGVNADHDRSERLRTQTRDFSLVADLLAVGAVASASVGVYTLLTRKAAPRVVPAAMVTPSSMSGGLSGSF
jgi:hypothetical protein